jgi:hypothetical protein
MSRLAKILGLVQPPLPDRHLMHLAPRQIMLTGDRAHILILWLGIHHPIVPHTEANYRG